MYGKGAQTQHFLAPSCTGMQAVKLFNSAHCYANSFN